MLSTACIASSFLLLKTAHKYHKYRQYKKILHNQISNNIDTNNLSNYILKRCFNKGEIKTLTTYNVDTHHIFIVGPSIFIYPVKDEFDPKNNTPKPNISSIESSHHDIVFNNTCKVYNNQITQVIDKQQFIDTYWRGRDEKIIATNFTSNYIGINLCDNYEYLYMFGKSICDNKFFATHVSNDIDKLIHELSLDKYYYEIWGILFLLSLYVIFLIYLFKIL